MIRRWSAGLLVIAALIVVFIFSRERGSVLVQDEAPARAIDPGYSARDARIVETGDDGRPRYRLHAELITQPPGDPRVLLTRPRLAYTDAGGGTWNATAQSGVVAEAREHIELTGEVELDGRFGGTGDRAVMRTERLEFDTERELATTAEPMTIDWSGHSLSAKGVRADLRAETLRLESRVHGRFIPR